jgi:hypothetical protein
MNLADYVPDEDTGELLELETAQAAEPSEPSPQKENPPRARTRKVRPKNNKRYTADECALAIVRHYADQFGEDDNFADPCRGPGAFWNAMVDVTTANDSDVYWCEIDPDLECVQESGPQNFLDFDTHTTWGFTNPPWSADEYGPIFRLALKFFENIVFLIRVQNATTTARRQEWEAAGFGLKEIAVVRWQDAGFPPEGLPLAAMHWQRGWTGPTTNSTIETAERRLERYQAMVEEITANVDKLDFNQRQILHGGLVQAAAMAVGMDPEIIFDTFRAIAATLGRTPPPMPAKSAAD